MLYYIQGWRKVAYFIPNYYTTQTKTKVSIIIPARNEQDTIIDCLNDILAQKYPQKLLQIIVVDDNSDDNTIASVRKIQASHANIELIELKANKGNAFKKRAISNAIAIADGELIISTDADCRMNPNWLPLLVNYYEKENPKMIAGPVCYDNEVNLFERMQTLEFIGLIGIGAASIGNKAPTMCNGANLAYQKQAFLDVGGFSMVDDLASGDDTFLMFKIEDKYPDGVHFIKNLQATVYTKAKPSLSELVNQRKRWASKSSKYDNAWVKIVAILVYLTNVSVLLSGVLSIINVNKLPSFLFVLAIKSIIDFMFLFQILAFFKRKSLLLLFIPEQILYVFYVVFIGAIAPFGKYNWKGRMIK
jgi:cellulose synthase/poly-beta-1,6-N-acetylglucosamine synthase-like glycosyltransferase